MCTMFILLWAYIRLKFKKKRKKIYSKGVYLVRLDIINKTKFAMFRSLEIHRTSCIGPIRLSKKVGTTTFMQKCRCCASREVKSCLICNCNFKFGTKCACFDFGQGPVPNKKIYKKCKHDFQTTRLEVLISIHIYNHFRMYHQILSSFSHIC